MNPESFDLTQHGLTVDEVHHNLPPSALYEHAIRYEKDASIAENGALVAYSGEKTGRSPKDKRVVEQPASENDVWWGPVNIPLDAAHVPDQPRARDRLPQHARAALLLRRLRRLGPEVSHQGPRHLLAAVSRAVHAHHAHPADDARSSRLRRARLRHLQRRRVPREPPHRRHDARRRASTSASRTGEFVILGTEYAGEMKKGVFTVMNYLDAEARRAVDALLGDGRPRDGATRRCSSACRGTGKTTLSADPKRHLIGDDEHCWSDDGIFNIEGGCYAKAINLTPESEPDIFQALRFGAVLENVVLDDDHDVDLHRHEHHREHARRVSDRVHPQREDPLRRRPPDGRHLPDLRRVRRAAAGQRAHAGAGDVSLHQRLHGEGRRHRGGRDRAAGDVLAVLRRAVPRLAPEQVRRAARREAAASTTRASGWSTPAGAAAATASASASSLKYTRAIIDAIHNGALANAKTRTRSGLRLRRRHRVPGRAGGDPASRATPGPTRPPTTPRRRSSPASSTRTSRPTLQARAPR